MTQIILAVIFLTEFVRQLYYPDNTNFAQIILKTPD